MEVRHADVNAFFQTLETIFNKAVQGATPKWSQIAMRVPSNGEANVYAWMEQLSGFRKWVGPRLFDDLKSLGYTLTNEEWEKSVQIKRNSIDDDAYGVYSNFVEQLAVSGAYHPDVMVGQLLDNAFTSLCYDGKPFYATGHRLRENADGTVRTIDNVMAKPLTGENFAEARTMLRRNIGGGDNPFAGSFEITLIVPAEEEMNARMILERERADFGADNPYKGLAKLLVLDSLENTKQWHVHVTGNPIKALIYQDRRALSSTSITDPNDSSVKETGYYKFMADYRGAYGYSLPVLAVGSTGGN